MCTLKLDISHIRILIIGLAGEFRVNTELFSYAKPDIFYSIKFKNEQSKPRPSWS